MSLRVATDSEEKQWYCLRAQPKREHVAAALLRKKEGLEVLTPRIGYKKKTQRGVVRWVEPMFPGYFFARISINEDVMRVRSAMGVTGLVHFNQKHIPVAEDAISELKQQVGEEDILELDQQLVPGAEVTVIEGAMTGEQATVLRVMPAKERVEVLLNFLGDQHIARLDWKNVILSHAGPVLANN